MCGIIHTQSISCRLHPMTPHQNNCLEGISDTPCPVCHHLKEWEPKQIQQAAQTEFVVKGLRLSNSFVRTFGYHLLSWLAGCVWYTGDTFCSGAVKPLFTHTGGSFVGLVVRNIKVSIWKTSGQSHIWYHNNTINKSRSDKTGTGLTWVTVWLTCALLFLCVFILIFILLTCSALRIQTTWRWSHVGPWKIDIYDKPCITQHNYNICLRCLQKTGTHGFN